MLRSLRELFAEDVDRWLAEKVRILSTRTLQDIRSILQRAVARAQARDKVRRNVVLLSELPTGQLGRPSKSLTLAEATACSTPLMRTPPRSGATSWWHSSPAPVPRNYAR